MSGVSVIGVDVLGVDVVEMFELLALVEMVWRCPFEVTAGSTVRTLTATEPVTYPWRSARRRG